MLITGTIGNYLKSLGLQQKWQKKKNDEHLVAGMKVVAKNTAEQKGDVYTAAVESFMKEQEELRGKIKSLLRENSECSRGLVEFKLQYGGKLSPSELEYIKNNCPDLYSKAMEKEKERQEYANQLRNCKSKDEVLAVRMNKLTSLMGDCQAAEARGDYGASFEIRARLYNAEQEYDEYIESDEYQQLCRREKSEKEAAEEAARQKKADETLEENKNQELDIIVPDEEKIQDENLTPGYEPTPPATKTEVDADKATPLSGKHSPRAEKSHDTHMAENKMKFAADKYKKNNPNIIGEKFDVRPDTALKPNQGMPENSVAEVKGNISINI